MKNTIDIASRQTAPYPPIEPFDKRWLAVGGPHELYVEQVGRLDGIAAVYLHGGPGGGCQPSQRRLFDPTIFRAVLFDQRGAGLSRPNRCLEDNTTWDLVADLERIREALKIERWLVVGGSWGSTLALAYAETHPERVTGLVLRAVFLGTAAEVDWAFRQAPQTFHPELWRRFLALLPEAERSDPFAAYGARMESPDPAISGPAARVWHRFESRLSVVQPGKLELPQTLADAALTGQRPPDSPFVEWHYMKRDFFLAPGQLLGSAPRLENIPGVIVQGRYDLLCPPATSRALADRWPSSRIAMVEAAGHALSDPGVTAAVLAGIESFKPG